MSYCKMEDKDVYLSSQAPNTEEVESKKLELENEKNDKNSTETETSQNREETGKDIKLEESKSEVNPLLPEGEEAQGLIKDNGDINWDCPCLQGMADGPCGGQFKDAFACFHYSEAEPKGVDCLQDFKAMQECFVKYPEIYGALDDDLDEEEKSELRESVEKQVEKESEEEVTAKS